jgi:hypothetical protein
MTAKSPWHDRRSIPYGGRASPSPPVRRANARPQGVDQGRELEQIVGSQSRTTSPEDDHGIRRCEAGPPERDEDEPAALAPKVDAIVAPDSLMISQLEGLAGVGMERVGDADALIRTCRSTCSPRYR